MSDTKIIDFKGKKVSIPDATQPTLCPECLAYLLEAVDAGGNGQCIKYCEENFVFAVATGRLGVVVRWDLTGPVLLDEAHRLKNNYVACMKAMGIPEKNLAAPN